MNDAELPQLEQQLEQLLAAEPPAALRARVARRVARELWSDARDWWTYLGLVAAALALWANLSWTVSGGITFARAAPPPSDALAAELRELVPEWSEAQIRHRALLLEGTYNPTALERRNR